MMSLSTSRSIAWITWIVASIFYAYQYILRVMPNIMLPEIMQHFQMDTILFGQFTGVYYIGYSLIHLPMGIMLDRFGPKKVITICILLSVLGLLPLVYSDHWIYPIIGRALIGIGSSAAILGVFKVIRLTFQEKLFPRMLSFSVTIGLMGAIYGGQPVAAMCQALGYQAVVEIFAGVGVVLALLSYGLIPHAPYENTSSIRSDVKMVLGNKKVLACCLFAGLMVGPLEGFADVWSTTFLKEVYGLDAYLSSSLPSLIFMGMCFGAPVLTLVAEKTKNYLLTIIGAGVIMSLCFFALITGLFNVSMMSLSFIMVGICSAYQILAIYQASTYVPSSVMGLTTALANMIIMSFGYAFHSSIGLILRAMGGPASTEAFVLSLSIIPLALSVGSLGFIWIYKKSETPSPDIS